MSDEPKFKVGDPVSFKLLKANHEYMPGADGKSHKGVIAYVQDNGNLSIDFNLNGEPNQVSVSPDIVTKA